MLLPALNKARERGRFISCANIIRQIKFTVTEYEDDYGDVLMPCLLVESENIMWMSLLIRGGYWDRFGFYDANRTMPKQFECPSEQRARLKDSGETMPHPVFNYSQTYDYGMNSRGSHRRVDPSNFYPFRKKGIICSPSQLSSLMDACAYAVDGDNTAQAPERHGPMKGNVVFMDGHVEGRNPIPFKMSGTWYGFPSRFFWDNTNNIYINGY